MGKTIYAADLFCGAGGTSTGLALAAERLGLNLNLIAVNHWDRAVETHSANHPWANHYCTGLDELKPSKAVPGGRLDLLVASPECTHHSIARGGKPMDDQSRASVFHVLHWCQELYVKNLIIENVPEFVDWGPLGANRKPLKSKKGQLFQAFLTNLKAAGYRYRFEVLTCADYGDATTRRRFFLLATRDRRQGLAMPNITHGRDPGADIFGNHLKPWRPARDIIDWTNPGHSIFLDATDVKNAGLKIRRPLAENTRKRIAAGIERFWGPWAEPFLVLLRGESVVRSVDDPIPAITAGGGHVGLCRPLLVRYNGSHSGKTDGDNRFQDAAEPITTLDTSNRFGLCQPLILPQDARGATRTVADGLPTITATGAHALIQPFITQANNWESQMSGKSIFDPLPSQTTGNHFGIVEPFMMHLTHGGRLHSVGNPVPTMTCANRGELGIVEPFIMATGQTGSLGDRVRGAGQPLSTLVTKNEHCLVQPFVVKYYGTGRFTVINQPLDTVTTDDRFGLVRPMVMEIGGDRYLLDILFRMFTPAELAAAHSFPVDYHFAGNKGEVVKQIGNSVPVRTARALCESRLAA